MNIHNDKTLYKIITGVFLTFSIVSMILAASAGGVKALLFTAWIIFALVIFWSIVVITINSGLSVSSKNILVRAVSGIVDSHIYCFALGLLVVLLIILSVGVWDYLDQRFPAKEDSSILVSEILNPMEKK